LMHWVWGGVYAHSPNDPVPLKRTGPDLPPLSHVGQVAPAGLERYRSAVFGEEFRGDLFWSQFNTRRVVRTRLTRDGATFRAQDEDFLVSDSVDFHPTDVLEDADGSLLVIDTGGWFRHGCPTSHIAKPEAKGAIYRIRRDGAPKADDPRGLKIEWAKVSAAELTPLLDDSRPAVQDHAIAALARTGDTALSALAQTARETKPAAARRNAVWTLARIDTPAARTVLRDKLSDGDASVRQAAVNALGWARDREAVPVLLKMLGSDSPLSIRRETAAALGRTGDERAVPPLLAALAAPGDAFLQHSLIYALIQIGQPEATARGLTNTNPAVRRGALLALGQMDNAALTREQVTPLLRAEEVELQRAAFSVAARDKALRAELLLAIREQLPGSLPAERAELFRETLAARAGDAAVRQLITGLFRDPKTTTATRLLLIEAMRQSTVKPFPAEWVAALEAEARAAPAEVQLAVIALARERALQPLDRTLESLAADAGQRATLRLACLDAIAPRLTPVNADLFAFIESSLGAAATPTERLSAARTLAALRLSDDQLHRLATKLPGADALILPTLLRAFARSTNDAVGAALVAALEKTAAVANVPADELARLLNKFPAETQAAAKPLLARLGADLEKQRAQLEALSPLLAGGDVGRGKQVFFGQKAACAACHRVSGQGGLAGPNLTAIAAVRAGRDLLESVLYPSASIVQGYQPFNVETTDGATHIGILVRQTQEAVWLRGADLTEVKIDTARIASMAESAVSLMPQGLNAALSPEELRDLLAFLQSLKRLSSAAPER
nr:HEAT repeat domain-containing protein [Verrucomicrobiota bacterium]